MRDWDRKAAAAIIVSVKTAAIGFFQDTVTAAWLLQETRQLHGCNRKLALHDLDQKSRSCMTAKETGSWLILLDKRQLHDCDILQEQATCMIVAKGNAQQNDCDRRTAKIHKASVSFDQKNVLSDLISLVGGLEWFDRRGEKFSAKALLSKTKWPKSQTIQICTRTKSIYLTYCKKNGNNNVLTIS